MVSPNFFLAQKTISNLKQNIQKQFLWDVLRLAFSTFGGPQVHLVMFRELLVYKRKYITEEELLETQALCSVLPGPTSTQTITALGLKLGGAKLAYLTLIIWVLPAITIMTVAALGMNILRNRDITRFIQPVGVASLIFAAFSMGKTILKSSLDYTLMLLSAILAFLIQSPWICPIMLLVGGVASSFNYKAFPKQTHHKMIIPWGNFLLWGGFLIFLALLGHFTDYLPIRLFENFYRNGSLVFGGGHVLSSILYTEFVQFKEVVPRGDFLTGMALSQSLPGPVFAFTSYLSVLILKNYTLLEQLLGSLFAAAGIFLPGTFLIFFLYRIWGQLKQFRHVRASLQGINASTTGLTLSAAISFIYPMVLQQQYWTLLALIITFLCLIYTRVPIYALFLLALGIGIL